MRVSYPELNALCKRVLQASGFPSGAMEDGAEMIAWAEFAGLKGLEQLAKELDERKEVKPTSVQIVADSTRLSILDGAGQSSLLSGRLAADLAYAKARENGMGAVEVINCRGPSWVAQIALQIAKRGMACIVSWTDEHNYLAVMQPEMGQPVIARDPSGGRDKTRFMIICLGSHDLSLNVPGQTVILQSQEIQERWHMAMQFGQEVDDRIWHKLVGTAAKVLVESTEISRLRGTGENA